MGEKWRARSEIVMPILQRRLGFNKDNNAEVATMKWLCFSSRKWCRWNVFWDSYGVWCCSSRYIIVFLVVIAFCGSWTHGWNQESRFMSCVFVMIFVSICFVRLWNCQPDHMLASLWFPSLCTFASIVVYTGCGIVKVTPSVELLFAYEVLTLRQRNFDRRFPVCTCGSWFSESVV